MDSHVLKTKLDRLKPHLNERQWRLLLAAEAESLGYGGVTVVADLSGATRATIHIGLKELANPSFISPIQIRAKGGGRRRRRDEEPGMVEALKALIEPETRGDPMTPLLYTTLSTRQLSDKLNELGYRISRDVVHNILQEEGYSLQGNVKTREGSDNPNRNAQFEYINTQVKEHLENGEPVVSVDTKKKELIGDFKNAGRQWRRKKRPHHVRVHDFPSDAVGKAIPYGVYDVAKNTGLVNVGVDHDTAEFAVASIEKWWTLEGKAAYPNATKLMITADGGGSNSSRNRLWRRELCRFAKQSGLSITVCHLPPGTSKWNKIEHRLFSHISINWRGQPLVSYDVILSLINGTTTRKGLKVKADLDNGVYPTEIKITDAEMKSLPIKLHDIHPQWNYTISADLRSSDQMNAALVIK